MPWRYIDIISAKVPRKVPAGWDRWVARGIECRVLADGRTVLVGDTAHASFIDTFLGWGVEPRRTDQQHNAEDPCPTSR